MLMKRDVYFLVNLDTNGTLGDILDAIVVLWLNLYRACPCVAGHDFDVDQEESVSMCVCVCV